MKKFDPKKTEKEIIFWDSYITLIEVSKKYLFIKK